MRKRRLKIFAASAILLTSFVVLVLSMTKKESMPELTPANLLANADTLNNQNVQLVGAISEGSSAWDAAKFELTFAVRELEGSEKVHVVYNQLKPDNFTDGGNVFVEGIYDAEKNLIVATDLQTKCASKYEEAVSSEPASSSL